MIGNMFLVYFAYGLGQSLFFFIFVIIYRLIRRSPVSKEKGKTIVAICAVASVIVNNLIPLLNQSDKFSSVNLAIYITASITALILVAYVTYKILISIIEQESSESAQEHIDANPDSQKMLTDTTLSSNTLAMTDQPTEAIPTRSEPNQSDSSQDEQKRHQYDYLRRKFPILFRRPILSVLLLLIVLVIVYVGFNYFNAVTAMENQNYKSSKQYYDNLFVASHIFSEQYTYVKAGVLMEEEEYPLAYFVLKKIDANKPLIDTLTQRMYSKGQRVYREGDFTEARNHFLPIKDYKESKNYLLLLDLKSMGYSPHGTYDDLVKLIEFEDTKEVLVSTQIIALNFLKDKWENGPMYILFDENMHASFTLPYKDTQGYYEIKDGIYYTNGSIKQFRFQVLDEDTMNVYCYKDGSTYTLYRQ
ncbi:MAG: hypothetical protein PHX79_08245 [Sphaerochaetaceae bacterium]|nr:hypothetical protein [Sphaerochaetaceae bacterium]MDD3289886.1 hypothetical protein [Eubacteriales bacterium]